MIWCSKFKLNIILLELHHSVSHYFICFIHVRI